MTKSSVVLIGDAYSFHGTDVAWMDFLRNFEKRAFLHTGGQRYPHDYSFAQGDRSDDDFFREFKDSFGQIDTLFARFSHFSKWIESDSLYKALDILKPKRFILGYHCHLAKPLEKEKIAFEKADGLVLLNQRQSEYFRRMYQIENVPVFHLRSLYLPRIAWYGDYPGMKRLSHFGLGGQSIRDQGRFSVKPFLRVLSPFFKDGSAKVTVFGDTREVAKAPYLMDLVDCSCISLPGPMDPKLYQAYLEREVSFGSLNGFANAEEPDHFDKENYPIRLNSYIKANVVPISASFGYLETNRIMTEDGFGYEFDEYDQVAELITSKFSYNKFALDEKNWRRVCELNSLGHYSQGLIDFIESIY